MRKGVPAGWVYYFRDLPFCIARLPDRDQGSAIIASVRFPVIPSRQHLFRRHADSPANAKRHGWRDGRNAPANLCVVRRPPVPLPVRKSPHRRRAAAQQPPNPPTPPGLLPTPPPPPPPPPAGAGAPPPHTGRG